LLWPQEILSPVEETPAVSLQAPEQQCRDIPAHAEHWSAVRSRTIPHRNVHGTGHYLQFLWQDDLVSVARLIADCFEHFESAR
jgi:hypothetical protein